MALKTGVNVAGRGCDGCEAPFSDPARRAIDKMNVGRPSRLFLTGIQFFFDSAGPNFSSNTTKSKVNKVSVKSGVNQTN